jgi:hypothetical protein
MRYFRALSWRGTAVSLVLGVMPQGTRPAADAVLHLPAGGGETVWFGRAVYSFKVTRRGTDGRLTLAEASVPPATGRRRTGTRISPRPSTFFPEPSTSSLAMTGSRPERAISFTFPGAFDIVS